MKKFIILFLSIFLAMSLAACGNKTGSADSAGETEIKDAKELLTTVWNSYEEDDKFAIAGGVASNSALRAAMKEACEDRGVKFYYPSPIFCTDNAAMIGVAAYYEYMNGTRSGWDLNAVPNLKLGER